ncbi:hypothetical protein IHE44_0005434 [Lamprotornis superbus]|uniref:Uncharacterized protein n=1 Tax=Lamprotornis superbus TaxID=245042 RepID=A0A835NVL7_9PASS|nr:hypothetical protein IHE44_0005434 [Lamprotornis superbus]
MCMACVTSENLSEEISSTQPEKESEWPDSMSWLMKKLEQLNLDIEEALSAGSSPSSTPSSKRHKQLGLKILLQSPVQVETGLYGDHQEKGSWRNRRGGYQDLNCLPYQVSTGARPKTDMGIIIQLDLPYRQQHAQVPHPLQDAHVEDGLAKTICTTPQLQPTYVLFHREALSTCLMQISSFQFRKPTFITKDQASTTSPGLIFKLLISDAVTVMVAVVLMVDLGKPAAFSVEEVMEVPARTVPIADPGEMKRGSKHRELSNSLLEEHPG